MNDKENKEVLAPAKDSTAKPQSQNKPPAKPKGKDDDDEAAEAPSRELASKNDYQLKQALNLLKGLQIMQSR